MGSLSFPSSSVEDTRHINWLSSSLYASVAVFLEDSGLLITLSASANQHITNNILCKKPEEWRACLPLLLKSILSRAKDLVDSAWNRLVDSWRKPSKEVTVHFHWWRGISAAIRWGKFIWILGVDSNRDAFHQSTQYHMAASLWEVTMGGKGLELFVEPFIVLEKLVPVRHQTVISQHHCWVRRLKWDVLLLEVSHISCDDLYRAWKGSAYDNRSERMLIQRNLWCDECDGFRCVRELEIWMWVVAVNSFYPSSAERSYLPEPSGAVYVTRMSRVL